MDEEDPLWQLLKQARPSVPDGSLASRTLARLAVEKSRRRRRARLGWVCAISLSLVVGGGGVAAWLVNRGQGQETGLTRAALASIDSNPAAEDVGWLQEQLSAEPGEQGETVIWEEASSF